VVASDVDVVADGGLPELAQPIDRAVLLVQIDDLVRKFGIAYRALGGPAGLPRVVRGRADRGIGL
jgi:hypothetical protein